MWCCARDEGWPFGAVLRGEAPNHRVLRWPKTVVVSDAEKAHLMRQVGTRKTVRSLEDEIAVEVSLSKSKGHQNRDGVGSPGRSLAGAR
jgi:hypothetical protein